jgi:hypothetical protein
VYVRPLLEYACCVWSLVYANAIQQIESVQRRFTKRLPAISSFTYAQRLAELNMDSLEFRRLHYDLILTYKFLFELVDVCPTQFFKFVSVDSGQNIRGHQFKLFQNFCRINTRQHFFCERVIQPWNSLTASVNDFTSLSAFKRCLHKNKDNPSKFLSYSV